MKHSISPYPDNIKVVEHTKEESSIYQDGKKIGEVNYHLNWGTDWLSYFPSDTSKNKFFKTKTEAVKHLIEVANNYVAPPDQIKEGEMLAVKNGDEVVIYAPDGEIKMSVFEYRRKVWDIETEYSKTIVFQ